MELEKSEVTKFMKLQLVVLGILLTTIGQATAQSRTWDARIDSVSVVMARRTNIRQLGGTLLADTAHYAFIDTNRINFKWWPSFLGADLFVDPEFYGIHLTSTPQLGLDLFNVGVEIRVHRVFVDYEFDVGGNYYMILEALSPRILFSYSNSISAGVVFHADRLEAGILHGGTGVWWDQDTPPNNFTAAFLGAGTRYGHVFFVEPELKVMFPLSFHHDHGPFAGDNPYTERYHPWDLFFGLSVKLGIGFN